jgi:two-component system, NarL family, nitrate/nitrite response regulator NarL
MKTIKRRSRSVMKILVADDHILYTNAVAECLETRAELVSQAYNSEMLFKNLELLSFDILLLDYHLPYMNGIDAAKMIREMYPELRILMVSMHRDTLIIRKLLELGIRGYFCKDGGLDDLLMAIHSVMEGNVYLDRTIINKLYNTQTEREFLTEREKDILGCIADGLSTSQVAQKLHISENTVEFHRRNMLQKHNCKNIAQLIRMATLNNWI